MTLFEARKHPRLVQNTPVSWAIASQHLSGEGVLLDVSLTGARVQMSATFDTRRGATFTLNAAAIPALPRTARLRWFRRVTGPIPVVVCGLIFEDPDVDPSPWFDWIMSRTVGSGTRVNP